MSWSSVSMFQPRMMTRGSSAPRASAWIVRTGIALTLLALLVHAWRYDFLTDDAYISFRYAHNLSHGHGLVFNPGLERVEGYSNFAWVVLLAVLQKIGIAPERAALPLSFAATVALWWVVVDFAARRATARDVFAVVVAPALLLASNRSLAVWSSSGLETRLFELLVVGGTLRLADELASPAAPRRSAWWFGLAALTRPDGILFGAAALATAAAVLARRAGLDLRRVARDAWPFVLLVAAHFAFRRAYYGEWLPNTYAAKVGGRLWWDSGFAYLAQFAIEYALPLWAPWVIAGAIARGRAGAGHEPLLFGAVVLPHALYVAAIGGDHFEYRPLDVAIPFLFLLAGFGVARALGLDRSPLAARSGDAARASGKPSRTTLPVATLAALAITAWAAFELPWRSHVEFPARYLPGFPGVTTHDPERREFLDPRRLALYRLPGFDALARLHRGLLRASTRRLVGIRAEEHAHFLATVAPEGRRLRAAVEHGLLPADTHLATGAVGAIPYYSRLRTLDRLGLTDARVARSAPQAVRVMAHDRSASFEEGRVRGVDLWAAHDVHFVWPVGAPHPVELAAQGVEFYAAALDSSQWLIVMLPQGIERTRARFPKLRFVPGASDAFLGPWFARGRAQLRDSLARRDDDAVRRDLALLLLLEGRTAEAADEYRRILGLHPDDALQEFYAGDALAALGRPEAHSTLERALAHAEREGDRSLAARIARRLDMLDASGASGASDGPKGPASAR